MDTEADIKTRILIRVANKLGLEKWHHQQKNTNGEVLNHLGNLIPVSLVDESSEEAIDLMIKLAPQVPDLEEVIGEAYRREVYVYNTLMPIFTGLDTGVDYEKLFPKCIYADSSPENRVLVMNDIRFLGFMNCSEKYLDIDHMNVSLKTVAQYHALSMILSEKKIKPPNDYVLRPILSNDPEFYYTALNNCVSKYVTLFENTVHGNFLVKLMDNFANHMDDSALKARRLVYGHGDFWKENILFEYRDKKPVRACLVDYQVSRLMSPAHDVLYLVMNGTKSNIRRQNFKTFLSTYYNELQKILLRNGLDPKILYSEEDFHHDLKLVFPLCLIVVFMSHIMWLGFEGLDDIITFKTENNIPDGQRKDKEEQLKRIIEDLIEDFKYLGFVDYNECSN